MKTIRHTLKLIASHYEALANRITTNQNKIKVNTDLVKMLSDVIIDEFKTKEEELYECHQAILNHFSLQPGDLITLDKKGPYKVFSTHLFNQNTGEYMPLYELLDYKIEISEADQ